MDGYLLFHIISCFPSLHSEIVVLLNCIFFSFIYQPFSYLINVDDFSLNIYICLYSVSVSVLHC